MKYVQQRRIRGITEGFLEETVFELSTEGRKKVRRMGNGGWDRTERRAAQHLMEPETRRLWPQRRQKRRKWPERQWVK